jgi:hypothetical protein
MHAWNENDNQWPDYGLISITLQILFQINLFPRNILTNVKHRTDIWRKKKKRKKKERKLVTLFSMFRCYNM